MAFSYKKKLVLVFLICSAFIFILQTSQASALDTGINTTKETAFGGSAPLEGKTLSAIIGQIVGSALSLLAVLFMVLMVYGGFIWMIARGNDAEVTKAKELITAAVIGLVIVISAFAITKFIGTAIFGSQ